MDFTPSAVTAAAAAAETNSTSQSSLRLSSAVARAVETGNASPSSPPQFLVLPTVPSAMSVQHGHNRCNTRSTSTPGSSLIAASLTSFTSNLSNSSPDQPINLNLPLHNAAASSNSPSMLTMPMLHVPHHTTTNRSQGDHANNTNNNNNGTNNNLISPSAAFAAAVAASAASGAQLCPFDQSSMSIHRQQYRQYLINSISADVNNNSGASARGADDGVGVSRGRRLRSHACNNNGSSTANANTSLSSSSNTNINNGADLFDFLTQDGHGFYHHGLNMTNHTNNTSNILSSSSSPPIPSPSSNNNRSTPSGHTMLSNLLHELQNPMSSISNYTLDPSTQLSSNVTSTSSAAAAAAAAAAAETDSLWPDSHDIHDDDVISVNSEVFISSSIGENGGGFGALNIGPRSSAAAVAAASRNRENNMRSMDDSNRITNSISTRARRSLCSFVPQDNEDENEDNDSICVVTERERDMLLHAALTVPPTQSFPTRMTRSRAAAEAASTARPRTAASLLGHTRNSARPLTAIRAAAVSSSATLSSPEHLAGNSDYDATTRATRRSTKRCTINTDTATRAASPLTTPPAETTDAFSSRPNTRASRKRNHNEISSNSTSTGASAAGTATSSSKRLASDLKYSALSKKPASTKECEAPTESIASQEQEDKLDESKKCCICLEVPKKSELAQLDGCTHPYCFGCIEQWAARENTCPQCKKKFNEIKRVHKMKIKKKRGKGAANGTGDFCVNVKKVKDRDQRSDYRQHNHLQSLFAHMEAHGLGVLLSSTNSGLFPGMSTFMQHESARGVRTRSSRVVPGSSLARPTLATTMRGPPSAMNTLEQILGGSRVVSSSNIHGASPLASTNSIEDLSSPISSSSFIPRRSSRGLSRRTGRHTTVTTSRNNHTNSISNSIFYQAISNARRGQGSNLSPTPSSHRNATSSATAERRNSPLSMSNRNNTLLSMNDILTSSDFHDPLFSISQLQPRSFATNGNEIGAGVSAATALEIMDDSDDDDNTIQVVY